MDHFFLQNETDREICAKLLQNKNEGCVKNLIHRVKKFLGLENSHFHFLTGPILLFGYYFDLIKDAILVYRLQSILGGFGAIFAHYNKFSSIVSFKIICLVTKICPTKLYGWSKIRTKTLRTPCKLGDKLKDLDFCSNFARKQRLNYDMILCGEGRPKQN